MARSNPFQSTMPAGIDSPAPANTAAFCPCKASTYVSINKSIKLRDTEFLETKVTLRETAKASSLGAPRCGALDHGDVVFDISPPRNRRIDVA